MRMLDVALILRLDKDQVRELGLDDALEVGDECEVRGMALVTKSKAAGKNEYGPGTYELKIVKIGVNAIGQEEPMDDYAKRRNAELREG